jgi:RNA polymerase sigma-70 factor (ECF subfamily)
MSAKRRQDEFSSAEFLTRLKERDADAVQAVVHAYLEQILRAARGAGLSREEAEDTAQETFATFVQTLERFEGRSHVRTWLFGILYRKIAETRRATRREEPSEGIDELMNERFDAKGAWAQPPREADQAAYDAEVRRHIEECMEELNERQRLAFTLREVEELATEEICKILDVTRTNLGVILYRVRNSLRECLESHSISA